MRMKDAEEKTDEEHKRHMEKLQQTSMKLHNHWFNKSWIPQHIQEKLKTAVNNGMPLRELKLVLGNAKVCKTIIDQSEKKEELSKIFPVNTWFWYPKIRPQDLLERERELRGLAPNIIKKKIPLSNFLQGKEYLEDSDGIIVSPVVMRRIVKFFLDNIGRYLCIERGKTVRGKDEIYVIGEIAKSKMPRCNIIFLDKYQNRRKK